jgi:hypothetical protein
MTKEIKNGDILENVPTQVVKVLGEKVQIIHPNIDGQITLPAGSWRVEVLPCIDKGIEKYSQMKITDLTR